MRVWKVLETPLFFKLFSGFGIKKIRNLMSKPTAITYGWPRATNIFRILMYIYEERFKRCSSSSKFQVFACALQVVGPIRLKIWEQLGIMLLRAPVTRFCRILIFWYLLGVPIEFTSILRKKVEQFQTSDFMRYSFGSFSAFRKAFWVISGLKCWKFYKLLFFSEKGTNLTWISGSITWSIH